MAEAPATPPASEPLEAMGRRLTKDSLLLLSNAILLKGVTIISSILLARLLGPGQLGLWAVVTATGGLAWVVADLGLAVATMATVAERNTDPEARARVQTTALFLALGLGGLIVAGYGLIVPLIAAELYQVPEALPLFLLSTVTMFLSLAPNIFGAILQGQRRFKALAGLSFALGILNAAALVLGAWALGLTGAFLASLGTTAIGWAVYLYFFRGTDRIRWSPSYFRWDVGKRLLRIAFPTVTSSMVTLVGSWLTLTFLTLASGQYDLVGQYSVAWRVSAFVVFPSSAIFGALFPMAAETARSDPVLFSRTFRQTLRYTLIVSIPISLLLGVLAPEIVGLLYGAEYLGAAPLLALLVPAGLLLALTAWGSTLFVVRESMFQGATMVAIAVILQCIAGAVLIPTLLGLGIVASTLLHYFTLVVLTPVFLRGRPTQPELRRGFHLALLAAAGLLAAGIVSTQLGFLWRLVLLGSVLVAYIGYVQARVLTATDRRFLRSLMAGAARRLGIRRAR